ncbi:hypothetical protein QAD02_013866 [Eretmocerus hayati]|uniref:Uncharacterized protein n=1 Tax=Eretmocerus hayati TaxID=131215 RepID=A0ACC2P686_9HYME|nr:hypothetical protein QAD02_013866 [Eretmocerus hayati]
MTGFLQNPLVVKPFRLLENYDKCVGEVPKTEKTYVKGMKNRSEFDDSEPFKVMNPGLPPCLDHDIYEDVIAIIKSFEDQKETYSSIKNVTHTKRDIELIDQSEIMMTLTLWGDPSSQFKSNVGDIIALKRAKVTIYQGIVKLSSTNSSIIMYDDQGKDRKK